MVEKIIKIYAYVPQFLLESQLSHSVHSVGKSVVLLLVQVLEA